ncbi:MAG: hypothetical protein PVG79_08945, partial [Gemmatimonadales bacterium]
MLGALALVVLAPAVSAQVPDTSFVIQAVRVTAPPTIDGVIEEGEWAGAAIADDFIQYQPHLGEPSVVISQA